MLNCYLPLLLLGTIALLSVAVRQRTATQRNMQLDLWDMLHPSTYDDAMCVNAAVQINVLDYNVAVLRRTSTYDDVRSVNGVKDNVRYYFSHELLSTSHTDSFFIINFVIVG